MSADKHTKKARSQAEVGEIIGWEKNTFDYDNVTCDCQSSTELLDVRIKAARDFFDFVRDVNDPTVNSAHLNSIA